MIVRMSSRNLQQCSHGCVIHSQAILMRLCVGVCLKRPGAALDDKDQSGSPVAVADRRGAALIR